MFFSPPKKIAAKKNGYDTGYVYIPVTLQAAFLHPSITKMIFHILRWSFKVKGRAFSKGRVLPMILYLHPICSNNQYSYHLLMSEQYLQYEIVVTTVSPQDGKNFNRRV